jgi:hypothetical protein
VAAAVGIDTAVGIAACWGVLLLAGVDVAVDAEVAAAVAVCWGGYCCCWSRCLRGWLLLSMLGWMLPLMLKLLLLLLFAGVATAVDAEVAACWGGYCC